VIVRNSREISKEKKEKKTFLCRGSYDWKLLIHNYSGGKPGNPKRRWPGERVRKLRNGVRWAEKGRGVWGLTDGRLH